MIASIQPTHAYVLIYIYLHSIAILILFLPSASVTCGMLKIGLFVLLLFFSFRGSSSHFCRGQIVSNAYMRSGRSLIVAQGSLLVLIFPSNRLIHCLVFMLLSHAGLLMVNLRMGLVDGIYHYTY